MNKGIKEALRLKGIVRFVLQHPDGRIEEEIVENTIQSKIKYEIAKHLGDGTTDFAIDNLQTDDEIPSGGTQDGKDGIAAYSSYETEPVTLITTKDTGGTGAENWIQFKGVITNSKGSSYNLTTFYLGKNFGDPISAYNSLYSQITATKTLEPNATLTVYWKITVN